MQVDASEEHEIKNCDFTCYIDSGTSEYGWYFLLLPSGQRSFPDHQRQGQDFRFRYPGGDWPWVEES